MLRFEGATIRSPRGQVGPLELELPEGAIVGVCGPAAAGKSVLLKLACALLRPTEGRVLLGGTDVGRAGAAELKDVRARIGMVFQNDALFDSTTVLENVALPLLRRGVARAEAVERALAVLSEVALDGAAAKTPAQLSGGMKKRVGIARALVSAPQVRLYDDPTAGLDPATTLRILELALSVHRRLGGLTVIAGPDPAPLWKRCTLAVAMEHGKIVAAGPPAEVAATPEVRALFDPAAGREEDDLAPPGEAA